MEDHPPGGWSPGAATTPGGIRPWVDDHLPTEDHPQNPLKILPVGLMSFFAFFVSTVFFSFRLGILAAWFGPGFNHFQFRIPPTENHPPTEDHPQTH